MITGIYQIRNTVNGKVYVGSAVHIPERWRGHKKQLRTGKHHSKHLQLSWNKYGAEAFVFEVVEECAADMLLQREQDWLDSTQSFLRANGYNIYDRATGKRPMTFTYNGKTQTLDEWAEEYGLHRVTLWGRIMKRGYSIEEALTLKMYAKCVGKKPEGDHKLTPQEKSQRRRNRMNELGLCQQCGHHPPIEGISYCEACRYYFHEWGKQRQEKTKKGS